MKIINCSFNGISVEQSSRLLKITINVPSQDLQLEYNENIPYDIIKSNFSNNLGISAILLGDGT